MSRNHRKLSRSLEERNILASTTRASQISQNDNELKQKLDAINTSYKLSNKRIMNETRELREILYGLQSELNFSKEMKGVYTPSLLERRRRGRVRRTTVISVPSEDRKDVDFERDQEGRGKERMLEHSEMESVTVGLKSASHSDDVKNMEEKPCAKKETTQDAELEKLQVNTSHVFIQEITRDDNEQHETKSEDLKTKQNFHLEENTKKTWENESDKHRSNRRVFETGKGRSVVEHPDGRKKSSTESSHSFSRTFRGRFVTDNDTTSTTSTRKTSRTQQISDGNREVGIHRPSIGEESVTVPSVPKQRKISLNVPPYPGQRKDVHNRGGSPMSGHLVRPQANDSSALDSLPENLGGRRISVAHGRVRKTSRTTALPPLKEEINKQQESLLESWSDLAKCRYLRQEQNEISIDDIFRKE